VFLVILNKEADRTHWL